MDGMPTDIAKKHKRASERGNVLWFILVGIILVGSLTLILSRGGSSVDQSGDVEQLRIKAGQVLRYAQSLEAAVQNMKMQGVSENDISFQYGSPAVYTNANCTSTACRLFDVGGAGLSYRSPPAGTNDGSAWIFTAANNVGTSANPIGRHGAGSGNDLIMLMPNANTALCGRINRELGVSADGSIPVDTTGIATTAFDGSYPNSLTELDGDPTPFDLNGISAGCFTDDSASITYFYYVLLSR
jgi:hypothetical protein